MMAGPRFTQWSVSVAATGIADYQALPVSCGEAPSGGHELGSQAVGFRVCCDTATAGGTIRVVMAHPDGTGAYQGVCEVWDGTITATNQRTVYAGGAGYYVCDVVFTKSGTNYVDVGGCADPAGPSEARVSALAGITGMGSAGTYRIEAWSTRNAQ